MSKSRHSKLKNSGILFELLTRQITAELLTEKENSPAIPILKRFFKRGSILNKELVLYESIITKKFTKEEQAKDFLNLILEARSKFPEIKLRKEKYSLIREIKEHYDLEEFCKQKVPNYKLYASISQLFEKVTDPEIAVNSKYTILEHLISKPLIVAQATSFESEPKEIRILAEKIMVERFNEKYKILNPSQKKLIKLYLSNKSGIREFIEEEVMVLRTEINKLSKKITDNTTKIKIGESMKILESVTASKVIKDNHILTVLNFYDLVAELKLIK